MPPAPRPVAVSPLRAYSPLVEETPLPEELMEEPVEPVVPEKKEQPAQVKAYELTTEEPEQEEEKKAPIGLVALIVVAGAGILTLGRFVMQKRNGTGASA